MRQSDTDDKWIFSKMIFWGLRLFYSSRKFWIWDFFIPAENFGFETFLF